MGVPPPTLSFIKFEEKSEAFDIIHNGFHYFVKQVLNVNSSGVWDISTSQNSLKNGLNIGNLARNFLKFSEKLQKYNKE